MNKLVLTTLSLVAAVSLNATVFATANGKQITENEIVPLMIGVPGMNFNALTPAQKKQIIDRAIELQLMIDKAKSEGIMSDPLYKKELEMAKDGVALRAWQAKKFRDMKVSDSDLKAFYNKNKNKFIEPPKIRAKHILVKSEKDAKAIINELKEFKGSAVLEPKFTEIAREKSIEPIAKKTGGELGWFSAGQMVKPFSTAAFKLKKGEFTTTPVRTQFGYHIILKEDERGKRQATFEEAKPFIEGVVKQEKFKDLIKNEAESLRKKAKITYGK